MNRYPHDPYILSLLALSLLHPLLNQSMAFLYILLRLIPRKLNLPPFHVHTRVPQRKRVDVCLLVEVRETVVDEAVVGFVGADGVDHVEEAGVLVETLKGAFRWLRTGVRKRHVPSSLWRSRALACWTSLVGGRLQPLRCTEC